MQVAVHNSGIRKRRDMTPIRGWLRVKQGMALLFVTRKEHDVDLMMFELPKNPSEF